MVRHPLSVVLRVFIPEKIMSASPTAKSAHKSVQHCMRWDATMSQHKTEACRIFSMSSRARGVGRVKTRMYYSLRRKLLNCARSVTSFGVI